MNYGNMTIVALLVVHVCVVILYVAALGEKTNIIPLCIFIILIVSLRSKHCISELPLRAEFIRGTQ